MDFDYFNFKSNNKVAKGSLILSQPLMKDLNFERSIILICEHNSEGSFGYKLNEKLNTDSVTSELDENIINNLFLGGPVENSYLNFVHNSNNIEESSNIFKNIYLGGNLESVLTRLRSKKTDFKVKFFSGYSGWSPGQLENEIKENSWIVINDFSHDLIFNEIDEKFWTTFLSKNGGKNKIFSNYPKDPSLN
tara:strand:+ start:45 stop:620 length:576 start_codon:yes stop_codon:yes gene_type:complete